MYTFTQHSVWIGLWGALLVSPTDAATLHDALEAAWLLQPEAQAAPARQVELDARRRASDALTPEPPSISLMHKTDQVQRNLGYREWEAEISVPMWLPGDSRRTMTTVEREQNGFTLQQQAAKLKVAGEVREAFWEAQLAESELQVAKLKFTEAQQLAVDVARRHKAGEQSKVDLNQAQSLVHAAQSTLLQTEAMAQQARLRFRALTGVEVPLDTAEAAPVNHGDVAETHPLVSAAQAGVATAQAKLAQVAGNRRDNPELSLAYSSERDEFGAPYDGKLAVRIKVPFGGDNRNEPRITAANAELVEAEARREQLKRQVRSGLAIAQSELTQVSEALALAETRAVLARDTQHWMEKAFKLGELDLPSLIRANTDKNDAELALARARIERSRALSRQNQAAGVLP